MSSLDTQDGAAPPATKPKRGWTFWRAIGWISLSMLMLFIIAAAYVWQNRYHFLENTLEDVLAEQGLEAQLSIRDIKKRGASLSNITISANGERVFSADRLTLGYEWRDALKGRMNRIELTGAALALTVDAQGKIIDGWIPASNPNSELALPPQGLQFNDSKIALQSPYGLVNATGDLAVMSLEDIKADIVIDPSRFSFGALEVKGGGKIKARIRPGDNAVTAALDFTDIVHPLAELSYASLNADVTFDLVDGQSYVTGPAKLSFAELSSDRLSAQNGKLDWDGSFSVRPNSAAIREADGKWAGNIGRLTYSDAAGRAALAKVLTVNAPLKAAPVTMHFADSLTETVKGLLTGTDISGQGEFLRAEDTVQVKLKAPLIMRSKTGQATFRPLKEIAFYNYDRETEAMKIAGDAALTGTRSVTLKAMRLEARSPNGLSITDVGRFEAIADVNEEWRAVSDSGPVRLSPLTAKVRYINQGGRRDMRVDVSGLEYDGPLPGGYATGFFAAGVLDVDLTGGGPATKFLPAGPMQLSRFQSETGWTASNAQFDLVSEAPFYQRGGGDDAALTARLEKVTTLLSEDVTGRALNAVLGAVDVSAVITSGGQDWALKLYDTEIKTDDFGGAGTVIGAPDAILLAEITPSAPLQIDLRAAAARVKTEQISTQDMKIALTGTPTAFHLDFGGESYASAGLVKFADDTLPQLPLRGQLDYLDGLITGNALTVLPKAEDADIDIQFRLKDGAGTAKIDIARMTFKPRGFQPQNLVPALQGKIAEVAGTVSANIDLVFAPDKPLQSFGSAVLNNLDFGTLPGPFRGVSTKIKFDSIFPLVSSGVQRMTVDSFNPGVDLIDGVIDYELVDDGIKILSAKWPLANGFISVDPAVWKYDAAENRVVLRIEDVSVGAFLGGKGGSALTVTGDVVGVIPVVVAGVDVRIEEGRLGIENGGVIQYRAQELTSVVDLIPENYVTLQDYQQFKAFQKRDDPSENAGKDLAFTALRNFEYKSLAVKLDGPLDGEIEVNIRFLGRNPKILAGTEFDFNVTIVGELVNLVRSLTPDSSMDRLKGYLELDDNAGVVDALNNLGLDNLGLGEILPPELQ